MRDRFEPARSLPSPALGEARVGAPAPSRDRFRVVMAGLVLALVMGALDQNIVNTALPRMASDLGGLDHLSWVVTAFMLSATSATPLYGKLSDMYGRKPLFTFAIAVFLAGSVLCGAAQSMLELILFRALQGLGAGGLLTLTQTVVADLVEPRERGRYQGLFTGAFAVSTVSGPVLGGFLTETLSWRWIFYVNLPVGAVTLALILFGLRSGRGSGVARRHRVDYAGAALVASATTAILLILSWGGASYGWFSAPILGLELAAALLLALLWRQERSAAEPILGIALFGNRIFAQGTVAVMLMATAMLGALVFVPLYFQLVLGKSPSEAGLMMLPQVFGMVFSSIVGGQISARWGRYKPLLVLGVGLEASSLGALGLMAALGSTPLAFEFCLAGVGLGMGIAMPNATLAVQNAVASGELGVATSTMTFLRSLGGSFGVALSGGVMAARLRQGLLDPGKGPVGIDVEALLHQGVAALERLDPGRLTMVLDAYRHAIAVTFAVGGGIMSIALVVVSTITEKPLRRG